VIMVGLLLSMALLDKRVRRKEINHIYENQPEIVNAKTGHVG
jgi:hypothetical protein